MKTTWEIWDLDTMRDDADAEGHTGLTAFAVKDMGAVATLPYFGAFTDYGLHVKMCTVCQASVVGCDEGSELARVSRVGVTEQTRTAASN